MTYIDSIKRGFKTFTLDEVVMQELADDESATGHGFLTLIITGVLFGVMFALMLFLLSLFLGPVMNAELAAGSAIMGMMGIGAIVIFPIFMVVGFFIGYSIYHLLAKLFKGQATGTQYFRAVANSMVINWPFALVIFIPLLGSIVNLLLSIWLTVVLIVITKVVHKLSTGRAVAVVLLPILVVVVLALLFFTIVASNMALMPPPEAMMQIPID